MSVFKPYTILFLSVIVTAYLFYVTIPVPNELQPSDEIFWIYLKKKVLRAISIIGETIGFDSHVNISRNLGVYSAFNSRGRPKYTSITVENLKFGNVPVNLIKPKNFVDNGPTIVWFHGGGWVYGNAASDDHWLELIAVKLSILIFSIEYRLAPEHIFPEPFNDCYNAVVHLISHAKQYNVNPMRIALAGSSAGGNLAAAVILKLRNEGVSPQPILQVLIAPCLQAINLNTPSYQLHKNNPFMPQYYMANFWLWYALGPNGHRYSNELISGPPSFASKSQTSRDLSDLKHLPHKFVHAHYTPAKANAVRTDASSIIDSAESVFADEFFAPLMASDLTRLPPTYVIVAEFDVLRDDGLMWAERLADAGNDVTLKYYRRSFHSLLANADFFEAKLVLDEMSDYLVAKL